MPYLWSLRHQAILKNKKSLDQRSEIRGLGRLLGRMSDPSSCTWPMGRTLDIAYYGAPPLRQGALWGWIEEGLKIVNHTPVNFFNLQSSNPKFKKHVAWVRDVTGRVAYCWHALWIEDC